MATNELSLTEENYLKAIHTLSEKRESFDTSTNEIAERVRAKPPTVSVMLSKLKEKKLIHYEKYKRVQLTKTGVSTAVLIIRKHRLWEVFLYEKLEFTWDEVHEVAEELEHIHSEKLISRLEKFLGFPKFDPHGDPIPSAEGQLTRTKRILLSEIKKGEVCSVVGVNDSTSEFLQYLKQVDIGIGTKIEVLEKFTFDGSLLIQIETQANTSVSQKFADNLLVSTEQGVKK